MVPQHPDDDSAGTNGCSPVGISVFRIGIYNYYYQYTSILVIILSSISVLIFSYFFVINKNDEQRVFFNKVKTIINQKNSTMFSKIKKILKIILPEWGIKIIKIKLAKYQILKAYLYDYKRYLKYSTTIDMNSSIKLEGIIIKGYHTIEKGLTMPEPRLGFGQDKIKSLVKDCERYIRLYDLNSSQVRHAIEVIDEYEKFHNNHGYYLPNEINSSIRRILTNNSKALIEVVKQIKTTKEDYFKHINSSFVDFSNSRKSVRIYSNENIPIETIRAAIKLALNAPSACNRQTARIYLYSNKEEIQAILALQNGNRGFNHLVNKLIVRTVELGVFGFAFERNQAFIDGGIFAMNMLYALHAKGIGCCMLNCSNTPPSDKLLQQAWKTTKSEVYIAMISCGFCPIE